MIIYDMIIDLITSNVMITDHIIGLLIILLLIL